MTTKRQGGWWIWLSMMVAAVLACGQGEPHDAVASRKVAFSTTGEVLSFETLSGWTTNRGNISLSPTAVHGDSSLAVSLGGDATLTSVPVGPVSPVDTHLTLDVLQPQNHPNPWWRGAVKVVLISPTLGMYWQELQEVSLQGLPLGQFVRLTFPIPADVRSQLNAQHPTDLTIKVLLNVPMAQGPWLLDRLSFGTVEDPKPPTDDDSPTEDDPATDDDLADASVSDASAPDSGGSGGPGEEDAGGAPSGVGPGTNYEFFIQWPASVELSTILLGSSGGDLRIGDSALIVGAGGPSTRANVTAVDGGGLTRLGVGSQVLGIWSDAPQNGPTQIATGAHVFGNVTTSAATVDVQAGASIDGMIYDGQPLGSLAMKTWDVFFPDAHAGSVDVTSDNSPLTLAPGAYGALNIDHGGELVFTSGQYTFESIGSWDGSAITLNNTAGPIQIYARHALTFQGPLTRTAASANVLIGFAGTGYAWLQNAANLNFALVAPWGTVTVHPPDGGNAGTIFAKSINADATQQYVLEPFVAQSFCSEAVACSALCPCDAGTPCDDDVDCLSEHCESGICSCPAGDCSPDCPCDAGEGTCKEDVDCMEGLVCPEGNGPLHNQPEGTRVCVSPTCVTSPGASGCYAPPLFCDKDADCPGIQPCLAVGWAYGYAAYVKLCVDTELCEGPDAEVFCGQNDSRCGYCDCVPSCEGKQCGDDPDDGCDGLCVGYCPVGASGCISNTECSNGTICVEGTCLNPACGTSECDPAECGQVCQACHTACTGRQCGTDPACGVDCGECPNGAACNDGMCEPPALDKPEIPAHPGYAVNTSGIGALPGSFAVSTQGRPNYSVPIDVPPSRTGVRPNVALSYSGTSAPGNAGVGWSLSAGSRIARCPKTAAVDGWPDHVRGTSNDAFCLDGQRLIHIGGNAGSSGGAKYRTEVETFNDITHYAGEGGDYWDVRSKDGGLWRYGAGLHSFLSTGARNIWPLTYEVNRSGIAIEYGYECRGTLNGTQCLQDPTLVSIEYGGRVVGASNPWGQLHTHRVQFEYEQRGDSYRGMTGAPGARQHLTRRLASIDVAYGGELVRRYRLTYGEVSQRADFLTSVTECVENGAGQETCLGPTSFSYNEPEPSYFASVSQYQEVPGVAATFGGGPVKKNDAQRRAQARAKQTLLIDFNGDGITDFLYPDTNNDWSLLVGTGSTDALFHGPYPVDADFRCITPASVGDFNADGRSDILDGCSEGSAVRIWYGTGTTDHPFNALQYTVPDLEDGSVMFPADMNADGISDIIGCETFKPVLALMDLGATLGATYDGPNFLQAPAPGVLACNFKSGERLPAPLLLDLDGDGAPNWLIRSGDKVDVLSIDRDPNTAEPAFSWQFTGLPTFAHEPRNLLGGPMRVMDLNGDGLQDVLQHVAWLADGVKQEKRTDDAKPDQLAVTSTLWLNEGDLAFRKLPAYIPDVESGVYGFPEPWLFAPYEGVSGEFFDVARVLDYDGDGRDEILSLVNTGTEVGWYVLDDEASTSTDSFVLKFKASAVPGLPVEAAWVEDGSAPMFADFDSDGAIDALFFRHVAGDGEFRLIRGTTPARYLLSSVTDGLGNRVEVTYDNDGSSYTPGETCDPHTRCLPRAGVLVDQIATYDGDDQLEGHTEFLYEDARIGLHGRGALGFRKRTTTDYDAAGEMIRSTTEEYDNGQEYDAANKRYPLAARLLSTDTITAAVDNGITAAAGGVVPQTSFETRVDYMYDQLTSDAGRPFVVPRLIVTRQFQLLEGSRVLSTTSVNYAEDGVSSFDQYGNNWFQETRRSGPVSGVGLQVVTVRNTFYPPGQRNPGSPPDPALWEVGLIQTREVESSGSVRNARFEYDQSTGLLVRSVRAPGKPEERVTTLTHDELGNIEHVRVESDVEVKESELSYDPYGLRLVSATGPSGLTAFVEQDPATGWVLSEVDANGVAGQRVYDRFGRLVQEITPTGDSVTELLPSPESFADYMVRRTTTDGAGDEATITTSEAHFDSRGRTRLTRATGLGGTVIEQRRFYNANGLLEAEELPHPVGQAPTGAKSYVYDGLGSLRQTTVPGDDGEPDVVETYQYGTRYTTPPELMPSTSVDSANTVFVARKFDGDAVPTTTFSGPAQQAVVRRRGDGPGSEETQISYGAFGQVSHYRGASNTLAMTHDAWGRVLSVTDSDIGTVSYSYDAFDRVETMLDGDSRLTTYHYDVLDRLVLATHPDATERFVFDRDLEAEASGEPPTVNSAGRLVRAVRETPTGNVAQTFRYQAKPSTGDPLNNTALLERVALHGPAESFETSYEYYPRSARVLVQHYPETTSTQPFGTRYCYDAFGSTTHIFNVSAPVDCTSPDAGAAPYWKRTSIKDGLAEDGYELGNAVEVILDLDPTTYRLSGHSVMADNETIAFSYTYEPGGRLKSENRAGLDISRDYTYGQSGVLETVNQNNNPIHAAEFDDHFRLEHGVRGLGTFSYDSADGVTPGNRLKEVTDDTGAVVATFDYDGRGNQISRQGSAIASGEQSIAYNDFNLPDTIVTGTGASATTVAFDYNATGQRIHTLRPTSELWHFADIYEKELRSTDPDADEVHRYWVFARGKRLAQIERSHRPSDGSWSESTDYLHYDRLGNVIAMSDESGDLTDEMTYSVYGEPEQTLPTAFGYTGHRHEQDLGLVDARGRFYDPKFGVFLSADPASPLGGGSPRMNRYAYVGYDPVNFTDPSGYFIVPMAIAAWQMYGSLAVAALFVPTLNYVVSGDFSYDWDKESWTGLGVLALSTAAGAGCAALAAPSGPVGMAFGFGLCAGAVGGAAGAWAAGGSTGDIVGAALRGAILGYVGAGAGLLASGAAFAITTNPYVHAGLTTFAGSATQVGLAAASGSELDWGRIAVQGAFSGLMAFIRAAQVDAAMTAIEAARGESAWLEAELSRMGQTDPHRSGAPGTVAEFREARSDKVINGAVRGLVSERSEDGRVYFRHARPPSFMSQRTAEFWATRQSLALSTKYGVEYGAAVVPAGDAYTVSTYVTSGESGRIRGFASRLFSVGVELTSPGSYVAFAHGHPIGAWQGGAYTTTGIMAGQAERVSAADLRFARTVGANLNVGTPSGRWFTASPGGIVVDMGSVGIWDPFYAR